MNFSEIHAQWQNEKKILSRFSEFTSAQVKEALNQEKLSLQDLAALLSPAAEPFIEEMAQKAHQETVKRFGYTMSLFTPLYLSNECVNSCVYCGFNHHLDVKRKTLSLDELREECSLIRQQGFEQILLVSGESKKFAPVSYLKEAVTLCKEFFHFVALEVYSLAESEYAELVDAGLDGVTLFQETYHPDAYPRFHPAGPKSFFENRLDTLDRAARAGVKKLNLGALLGLTPWREETLSLAFHLDHLRKNYWTAETAVSFPRIRSSAGSFMAPDPVSDFHLTQMITALRLYDDRCGLVLSTREPSELRNALAPLGITSLSAGAKTNPGGHLGEDRAGEDQFRISDPRSPEEVSEFLRSAGYEPVWKDWERSLCAF